MATVAKPGLIPGDTQTNSKRRFPPNAPRYALRGDGCYLWCDDGRKYIDYVAALGPVILGYNHPAINQAIVYQLQQGISFSLPTHLEGILAEWICDNVPGAEMVRFAKNGADATAAALRLARAFTSHKLVFVQVFRGHYHGYHLLQGYMTDIRERMPPNLEHLPPTAAVICEPKPSNPDGIEVELTYLREWCESQKSALIVDEIVTFGRFPGLTASAYFNVTSDLICLGKALGNGMPLSAVCGKREIMQQLEGDVFFSTTFGGEALSLAAAIACCDILKNEGVPEQLWAKGETLMAGFNAALDKYRLRDECRIYGYPSRPVVKWEDDEKAAKFDAAMIENGVLYQGYFNVMQAHGDAEIAATLEAIDKSLATTTRD